MKIPTEQGRGPLVEQPAGWLDDPDIDGSIVSTDDVRVEQPAGWLDDPDGKGKIMLKWFDTQILAWGLVLILAPLCVFQSMQLAVHARSDQKAGEKRKDDLDSQNALSEWWAIRHEALNAEKDAVEERNCLLEEENRLLRLQVGKLAQSM